MLRFRQELPAGQEPRLEEQTLLKKGPVTNRTAQHPKHRCHRAEGEHFSHCVAASHLLPCRSSAAAKQVTLGSSYQLQQRESSWWARDGRPLDSSYANCWRLRHSSASDALLGFTTGLQPPSWRSSLEGGHPGEVLGQGMAPAAQNTAEGTSACSAATAQPHPRLPRSLQQPTLPCLPTPQRAGPSKRIPAFVSALTSLIFQVSLPTRSEQAAARDRWRGATGKAD